MFEICSSCVNSKRVRRMRRRKLAPPKSPTNDDEEEATISLSLSLSLSLSSLHSRCKKLTLNRNPLPSCVRRRRRRKRKKRRRRRDHLPLPFMLLRHEPKNPDYCCGRHRGGHSVLFFSFMLYSGKSEGFFLLSKLRRFDWCPPPPPRSLHWKGGKEKEIGSGRQWFPSFFLLFLNWAPINPCGQREF